MTRLSIGSTLIVATLVAASGAQDPAAPIPYVASVKRNTTGTGGFIRIRPGNISVMGMPIRILIRQAYGQVGCRCVSQIDVVVAREPRLIDDDATPTEN